MQWVAQQRYTYMVLPTLAPFELRRQSAVYFRECCEKAGYTARHAQIGWGIGIYVAETDEQARREYEPHFWYYARNLLKTPAPLSLPPGHTSLPTMLGMAERRLKSRPGGLATWAEVEQGGYVVVGSPETVRQRLEDYAKRVGFGVLVANFSVGNVPHELTRKSMTLFAQEVMPKLQEVNVDTPAAAAHAAPHLAP
jgi:alkanesulfonate monooxygenase SsuD/methylene tetrahydromethanopterin reductase-like flavin-dependent oxidoreductase (luciferase family)